MGEDFIPTEIKIPVVSSLGIKAIIKIGEIDYTPMSQALASSIFLEFKEYNCIALNKFIDPQEQDNQDRSFSYRSNFE